GRRRGRRAGRVGNELFRRGPEPPRGAERHHPEPAVGAGPQSGTRVLRADRHRIGGRSRRPGNGSDQVIWASYTSEWTKLKRKTLLLSTFLGLAVAASAFVI